MWLPGPNCRSYLLSYRPLSKITKIFRCELSEMPHPLRLLGAVSSTSLEARQELSKQLCGQLLLHKDQFRTTVYSPDPGGTTPVCGAIYSSHLIASIRRAVPFRRWGGPDTLLPNELRRKYRCNAHKKYSRALKDYFLELYILLYCKSIKAKKYLYFSTLRACFF